MNEMKNKQAAHAVLMVRPAFFGYNHETSLTNAFQQVPAADEDEIHRKALSEFNRMVDILKSHDVLVHVFEDTPEPRKPDAIFPNNWVSFHDDGTVILYPMQAAARRAERRMEIIEELGKRYTISKLKDYSAYEKQDSFLEGTGSLVFDYVNRFAYACLSLRTHESLVHEVCKELNFKPVIFHAVDEDDKPIYHTNVVLTVAEKLALICLDAIRNENEIELLLNSFRHTGHRIIAISYVQMKSFAGNMMEVKTRQGDSLLVMSESAYLSLLPGQLSAITQLMDILVIPVPTIEKYGGGSVRCMMTGIFNPS